MRVASDIAGTFTDLVFLDPASGETGTVKSSTTVGNYAEGVMNTLRTSKIDISDTRFFVHGSTVVINTITERKGTKTGLITTKGFRDVLEITRANRPDLYNMYYRKPKPFIPRRYRLEVRERINHRGEVLTPLDEGDLRTAAEFFRREAIEAVAVCLFHSYANPVHEQHCGRILHTELPGIPVTLSWEITQEWREYERTNTAVLNSYVKKRVKSYLDNLEDNLNSLGMRSIYHIMQSNGGTATFGRGKEAPINMIESGPVGGVIGTAAVGKMLGEMNTISFDVGGTTAKTSLILGGRPRITTEYKIEWSKTFADYPVLTPTVYIVEIGAGGGSIAWVDDAGALKIGPKSAGADPGPACYGLGGEQPTVTDAQVVAGRINPNYFLGGEIPLSARLAEQAVARVGSSFGTSLEETAMGIIRIEDAGMVNAMKLVSVRRGHDPREFVLVAFGGGGAMHAPALARELRVKKVIIPPNPGVFSAWGMLVTDLRQDFIRTHIQRTDQTDPSGVECIFREMEDQAMHLMHEQNVLRDRIVFHRSADMRYLGQEHTVKTPFPEGTIDTARLQIIEEKFQEFHAKAYSFRLDAPVELVNYHLTCFGMVEKPALKSLSSEKRSLS